MRVRRNHKDEKYFSWKGVFLVLGTIVRFIVSARHHRIRFCRRVDCRRSYRSSGIHCGKYPGGKGFSPLPWNSRLYYRRRGHLCSPVYCSQLPVSIIAGQSPGSFRDRAGGCLYSNRTSLNREANAKKTYFFNL